MVYGIPQFQTTRVTGYLELAMENEKRAPPRPYPSSESDSCWPQWYVGYQWSSGFDIPVDAIIVI